MAQFHSTLQAQIDALMTGGGVIGDVYFATDTHNIFVCLGGGMVPLPNVLSGNPGPPGPPGPKGDKGDPGTIPNPIDVGTF